MNNEYNTAVTVSSFWMRDDHEPFKTSAKLMFEKFGSLDTLACYVRGKAFTRQRDMNDIIKEIDPNTSSLF